MLYPVKELADPKWNVLHRTCSQIRTGGLVLSKSSTIHARPKIHLSVFVFDMLATSIHNSILVESCYTVVTSTTFENVEALVGPGADKA